MAWRCAQDIPEGSYVNLGIGIPENVAAHVPAGREIVYQSENGVLGFGPPPEPDEPFTYRVSAVRTAAGETMFLPLWLSD